MKLITGPMESKMEFTLDDDRMNDLSLYCHSIILRVFDLN